jgi:hypothetical protein
LHYRDLYIFTEAITLFDSVIDYPSDLHSSKYSLTPSELNKGAAIRAQIDERARFSWVFDASGREKGIQATFTNDQLFASSIFGKLALNDFSGVTCQSRLQQG